MRPVLVVDDDVAILEVVKIVLEEEGYKVVTDTGEQVGPLVEAHRPGLVLLDIWMTGIDGRQVSQQLKRQHGTSLPVVLMSAHSSARSAVETAGADGFLEKPFEVEDLLSLVAAYLIDE